MSFSAAWTSSSRSIVFCLGFLCAFSPPQLPLPSVATLPPLLYNCSFYHPTVASICLFLALRSIKTSQNRSKLNEGPNKARPQFLDSSPSQFIVTSSGPIVTSMCSTGGGCVTTNVVSVVFYTGAFATSILACGVGASSALILACMWHLFLRPFLTLVFPPFQTKAPTLGLRLLSDT